MAAKRFSIFPKAFLWFFPLHLGAELITAMGFLNKASGFYGILSIFTGHPLDVMEWILNILSLVLLPVYGMAFLTVTQRSGLEMVLFCYVYTFDTLVGSIGFGIYNIVHWFTTKAKEMAANGEQNDPHGSATSMVEAVETAKSAVQSASSYLATAVGSADGAAPTPTLVERAAEASATPAAAKVINKSASLAQETSLSIVITVVLMLVRIYFTLCVIAYARQLARQQNLRPHNGSPKGSWRAKLQYYALSTFESFWVGYGSRYSSSQSGSSHGSVSSGSSTGSIASLEGSVHGPSSPFSNNKESDTMRLNQDFEH